MIYSSRFSRGQSILEAIILVAIVVVFVTGVLVSLTVVRTSSQYAKRRSVATQYAQEAMETLRGLRDSKYSKFINLLGNSPYCFVQITTTLENALSHKTTECGYLIDSMYSRTLTLTDETTVIAIQVDVSWQEASKQKTVTIESKLAKK